MKSKIVLGVGLLSLIVSAGSVFKTAKEVETVEDTVRRITNYSSKLDKMAFSHLNDVTTYENDNVMIITGTQEFDSSVFGNLDLTAFKSKDDLNVYDEDLISTVNLATASASGISSFIGKADALGSGKGSLTGNTGRIVPGDFYVTTPKYVVDAKCPLVSYELSSYLKSEAPKTKYVMAFDKLEGTLKVSSNFQNFRVYVPETNEYITKLDSIEGYTTYNNAGKIDVLYAKASGDVWGTDIKQSVLDNTGFWDWLCSVAQAVTNAVVEVVETVVEAVVEVVESFVETVVEVVEEAIEIVEEIVEEVVEVVIEVAADVLVFLSPVIEFFANAIFSVVPIENIAALCEALGCDFTDMIANGLKWMVEQACDTLTLEQAAKLLCMSPDDNGIYHASQNAWQAAGGYNDIYDAIFHLGTSMDREKFMFYDADGNYSPDYVLWAWKGDYWSLGAGGELGFYRRLNDSEHFIVDKKLAMDMSMKVKWQGCEIINWKDTEKNWWMTAFEPAVQNAQMEDIEIEYEITFNPSVDENLRAALEDAFIANCVGQPDNEITWEYLGDHNYKFDWKSINDFSYSSYLDHYQDEDHGPYLPWKPGIGDILLPRW